MKLSIATLGLVAACAVGCASTPVPEARVASTETTVRAARQAGADTIPEAKPHLTTAESKLGKAKSLIDKGDNDEASALLSQAESDATLAVALSREAQQKAVTDAAVQRVRSTSTPALEPPNR